MLVVLGYLIWAGKIGGGVEVNKIEDSVDNLDTVLELWLRYSELGLSPHIEVFYGDVK